jgi:DNA-binding winged helix-turn-helix (wHTH) protein
VSTSVRYRFANFVVSRRRRVLLRDDRELPLIPRYFDLLVLLLERRHDAVHRNDIFDRVWTDVVVSDGALSQAVRTLRRTLGDDFREPRFIRTVSRHGYRFVFADVIEELDDEGLARPAGPPDDENAQGVAERTTIRSREEAGGTEAPPRAIPQSAPAGADVEPDEIERLIAQLSAPSLSNDERRDAAERLHALGTSDALARLERGRVDHAHARALLRDARWDVAGSGPVPLLGVPGGLRAGAILFGLRIRRAWREVSVRWLSAAAGGAASGVFAGIVGGLLLWILPGTVAAATVIPVLGIVGATAGGVGAAGVGAGLAAAEAVLRSRRFLALVAGGSLGGTLAGLVALPLVRWTVNGLFGLHPVLEGGAMQGMVLGASAGVGYAWATRSIVGGGMAAPPRRKRLGIAATVALACSAGAVVTSSLGYPLVGGLVNAIARSSTGAQIALAPLGHLLGEPDFGPLAGRLIGMWEGACFGFGLALGLTRRPGTHD